MRETVISGFDSLGAESLSSKHPVLLKRSLLALAAGGLAALLYPKHWALVFLDTAAAVSNLHAVANGERTWKQAFRRMGRHVVATAGSLSLSRAPGVGYVAGAIAADLLIDEDGGGIIDDWARYEGVVGGDIIDATIVDNNPTNALVKR